MNATRLCRFYKLDDEKKIASIKDKFTHFVGIHGPITPRKPSSSAGSYRRPSSGTSNDSPAKRIHILDE